MLPAESPWPYRSQTVTKTDKHHAKLIKSELPTVASAGELRIAFQSIVHKDIGPPILFDSVFDENESRTG
jgi:hypothetical protein